MRKASLIVPAMAVAAAISPVPAQALAQHGPVPLEQASGPSATVAIADLDLGSGEDLQEMQRRIGRAVDRLCAEVASEPLAIHARAGCRRDALAQAGAQVSRAVREAEVRRPASPRTALRRAD